MEPASILIRAATGRDLPVLADLLRQLYDLEPAFTFDREKVERGIALALDSPSLGIILAAERAGVVVGMATLQYAVSTAEGGTAIHLDDLVVEARCRGEGIGKMLVDAAAEHGREGGAVRLTVNVGNPVAVGFYARLGFAPVNLERMRLPL